MGVDWHFGLPNGPCDSVATKIMQLIIQPAMAEDSLVDCHTESMLRCYFLPLLPLPLLPAVVGGAATIWATKLISNAAAAAIDDDSEAA